MAASEGSRETSGYLCYLHRRGFICGVWMCYVYMWLSWEMEANGNSVQVYKLYSPSGCSIIALPHLLIPHDLVMLPRKWWRHVPSPWIWVDYFLLHPVEYSEWNPHLTSEAMSESHVTSACIMGKLSFLRPHLNMLFFRTQLLCCEKPKSCGEASFGYLEKGPQW